MPTDTVLSDTTDLKKGTKVVATDDLPGVPEGTKGKLGDAVGLTLIRYRVDFENGVRLTSVTHDKVIPAKEWETFKADREAAAAKAAEEAAAPPAAEAAAEAPAAEGGASAKDERLAAMLAKSKAARERKAAGG